ncbi:hypothetical protein NDU88_007839 [Pleurodeles waltl]|uniref:Uncharacterized protein n=1 Tax=Pleurodeles waltl TaxID=8319 RepID=A0AAV7PMH5_PLEWA|nr:hypothetical protein NDU88_007839 [Pleurodeles waltl]
MEGIACAAIGAPPAPYSTVQVPLGLLCHGREGGRPNRALERTPRPRSAPDLTAAAHHPEGDQQQDRGSRKNSRTWDRGAGLEARDTGEGLIKGGGLVNPSGC